MGCRSNRKKRFKNNFFKPNTRIGVQGIPVLGYFFSTLYMYQLVL
jgi:hypothetical protein